mgnify:CR=1 FL=1
MDFPETADIIKGIAKQIKPSVIIAIDALAARDIERLNTTIQLSDRGINPGSGVGNHRVGINYENIGIPVLAIGVPTVIDALTIVTDLVNPLISDCSADEIAAFFSGIDNNIATASGVNVLAPTWYSVTDSSGNMSCYASAGLVNKMHQRGTDVWALVSDFDTNVDFAALYSSKKARTNMVNTLINDAEKYGFDGINLDCENIKSAYAKDYLQFVRELSIACERKGLVLSTDNYKPEAYNRCYNLKEQSRFVDYVIVMAYDEHYAGTDAGSVASLPFVKEAVEDTVQLVGKEHVIAGIPFYTRIWTTTDGNTTSRAVGMQAAVDQLNSDGQVALWNDDCGQYVASYTVGNATRQIWFEEEKSIEAKMQVIQENNVAGVAGWKLGLEKSSVWPVISKYNK